MDINGTIRVVHDDKEIASYDVPKNEVWYFKDIQFHKTPPSFFVEFTEFSITKL